MKRVTTIASIGLALVLGAIATLVLLWLLGGGLSTVQAEGPDGYNVYHVASSCIGVPAPCYTTVQAAVDATDDPGDVIKVAEGTYTGVQGRPVPATYPAPPPGGVITQVVYISKPITIRGGYIAPDFTDPPDPDTHPTTLDAQGHGRVLCIAGDISATIEGLRITQGNAFGLGGGWRGPDAGGGVYVLAATVTLSHNQVLSNTAPPTGVGGGLYFTGSEKATLIDNRIGHNRASPLPASGEGGGGGGARFYRSPEATLRNNVIHDNRASWGGGLCFERSPTATLVANVIRDNVANHIGGGQKDYGGVHFLWSDNATLISNTISGNYAANRCGGAAFRISDHVTLIGNDIKDNSAGSCGFGFAEGGGLLFQSSKNANLVNNTISGNRSHTSGGGLCIWNRSTVTLTGGTVTANKAKHGGGLSVGGYSFLALSDVTVTANSAISYPPCYLGGEGGGIYLNDNSTVVISTAVITDNRAETTGGGLCLDNSVVTLTNAVIADNHVITSGSGMYVQDSSLRLLHTTIARNSGGDGSGVHITGTGSIVALTNTILVSHTVGITVAAGNTATLEATLWGTDAWANLADWGGTGTLLTGTINLWGTPAFVDPDAGDYHITYASAAIDKGVDAGVTTDIDGDPRPAWCWYGYDLGADEFVPCCVYLPVILKDGIP